MGRTVEEDVVQIRIGIESAGWEASDRLQVGQAISVADVVAAWNKGRLVTIRIDWPDMVNWKREKRKRDAIVVEGREVFSWCQNLRLGWAFTQLTILPFHRNNFARGAPGGRGTEAIQVEIRTNVR
jgi:hypothetical protein